jgi:subtilisin family serine protease
MSVTYNKPDISAPGINILSAMPLHGQDKPWDVKHGTSMAAPHVSGAVAQLLSATDIKNLPAPLRAPVICDLLQAACLDVGEIGVDQRFGYGCLNIHAAIARARELGY